MVNVSRVSNPFARRRSPPRHVKRDWLQPAHWLQPEHWPRWASRHFRLSAGRSGYSLQGECRWRFSAMASGSPLSDVDNPCSQRHIAKLTLFHQLHNLDPHLGITTRDGQLARARRLSLATRHLACYFCA